VFCLFVRRVGRPDEYPKRNGGPLRVAALAHAVFQ